MSVYAALELTDSREHLLTDLEPNAGSGDMRSNEISPPNAGSKSATQVENTSVGQVLSADSQEPIVSHRRDDSENDPQLVQYRVYKRRFFGLAQLVLLNIVVSWDVSRSALLI